MSVNFEVCVGGWYVVCEFVYFTGSCNRGVMFRAFIVEAKRSAVGVSVRTLDSRA